jgi:hypothetical protein
MILGGVGRVRRSPVRLGVVAKTIADACDQESVVGKRGGTYVCMEGPQFSTRAESNLYRSWGADVIGMTNLQEAKLAREAEICYATMAMVTDYDCWRAGHDDVTVDQIVAVMHQNAANVAKVLCAAVRCSLRSVHVRLRIGNPACHSGPAATRPCGDAREASIQSLGTSLVVTVENRMCPLWWWVVLRLTALRLRAAGNMRWE